MNYNEFWDRILHTTWEHNPYLEIVTEILYKKYPVEDHEDCSDLWADPVVKSESEMRELIEKMEDYWKDKIEMLMETIDVLSEKLVIETNQERITSLASTASWHATRGWRLRHAANMIKDSAWHTHGRDLHHPQKKEN